MSKRARGHPELAAMSGRSVATGAPPRGRHRACSRREQRARGERRGPRQERASRRQARRRHTETSIVPATSPLAGPHDRDLAARRQRCRDRRESDPHRKEVIGAESRVAADERQRAAEAKLASRSHPRRECDRRGAKGARS